MGIIADVETAILATATTALGNTVRKIESIPGGWTMAALTRALQFSPGVYVAFLGFAKSKSEDCLDGRFACYMVTKGASEQDRRHGNQRVIGAYDMIEIMLPRLASMRLPDGGSLTVGGVDNLFRDVMFDLGGTVYGINLTLPAVSLDYQADLTGPGLADFILFHGEAFNEGGIAAAEDPLIIAEQKLNQ